MLGRRRTEGGVSAAARDSARGESREPAAERASNRPAQLALLAIWAILALTIAARRPDPAGLIDRPSRPTAPLTLDLNRDPWPRLMLIEGIGEALARRIVDARSERGGFLSFEEVKELPGIPDGAIDRALPWLVLGAIPDPPSADRSSADPEKD